MDGISLFRTSSESIVRWVLGSAAYLVDVTLDVTLDVANPRPERVASAHAALALSARARQQASCAEAFRITEAIQLRTFGARALSKARAESALSNAESTANRRETRWVTRSTVSTSVRIDGHAHECSTVRIPARARLFRIHTGARLVRRVYGLRLDNGSGERFEPAVYVSDDAPPKRN